MIRIWNYNKSRIHSFRGAKLLTCHLDDKLIFRGEVQRAPGNTLDPNACCEIILFSDEEFIFEQIDANDWLNNVQLASDLEDYDTKEDRTERPMTATKKFGPEEVK